MLVYCIADIHGEIERFHKMLELINFSDTDTLYILGDVIDRYPGGLEIISEVMDKPNIKMIVGNHEHMMLDVLGPINMSLSKGVWLSNGGDSTYHEWLYLTDVKVKAKILDYLSKLPDHLDIEVNGKQFHLVHAYPGDDLDSRVWNRPERGEKIDYHGKMVILGHTPTLYFADHEIKEPELLKIYWGSGFVGIDCGCGHHDGRKQLACLRLDDLAEFYV